MNKCFVMKSRRTDDDWLTGVAEARMTKIMKDNFFNMISLDIKAHLCSVYVWNKCIHPLLTWLSLHTPSCLLHVRLKAAASRVCDGQTWMQLLDEVIKRVTTCGQRTLFTHIINIVQTFVGSSLCTARWCPVVLLRVRGQTDAPTLKLSVNVPEQSAQLFSGFHAHCSQLWPRVWKWFPYVVL